MESAITIKQDQWQAQFFSTMRNDSLSYYANLYSTYQGASHIDNQFFRCKYCKAYPFSIYGQASQNDLRICQLCGSINQHQMRWQILKEKENSYYLNNSYVLKSASIKKTVSIILYLQSLEETFMSMFVSALKTNQMILSLPTSILLNIKGKLAIIIFAQQPQLVILSRDLHIQQIIHQHQQVMNQTMIQQFQVIVQTIRNQQINQINSNLSFQIFQQIVSSFNCKIPHKINILLWIGKLPPQLNVHYSYQLLILAIFYIDRKLPNAGLLIELRQQFNQVYYLQEPQAPTQLYYQLHRILNDQYLGILTTGVLTLKTNVKYSGSVFGGPRGLINADSKLVEIGTSLAESHKIQLHIGFTNLSGEQFHLIANYEQQNNPRKYLWYERVIMISKALYHVLQCYFYSKKTEKPQKCQMDSYLIRTQLQKYASNYENNTKLYGQIVNHMINYFKQFQKQAFKVYLPFSLLWKKELLFVFYPLYQGGVLHHIDSMWLAQQSSENVQWSNDVVGVAWSRQQTKLAIFYQLCVDNEAVSIIYQ